MLDNQYTESKLLSYLMDTKRDFGHNSSKVITYFTGIDAEFNPSGTTDNLQKLEYYKGEDLILTEKFTYDATNRITKIDTVYE